MSPLGILLALALGHGASGLTHPRAFNANASATSLWTIDTFYEGQNFFDGFNFFSYDDTTGGQVQYVDQGTAFSENLAYVTPQGQVVMRVDNTTSLQLGQQRKSVRIQSNKRYNGGLFILDIEKAPYGCSTWPAFWTVGPNWPYSGEIDIFEGVNLNTKNQVTFHTDPGCVISNSSKFTGSFVQADCNVIGDASNAGCGVINDSAASFGEPFNAVGGGVFASRWDASGVYVWFFHRSTIPHDITQNTPNPDNWGEPTALLANTSCPPKEHFWDHQIVFNIDICGYWAGNGYTSPQSPTGTCPGTCTEQVMSPSNFDNAYWVINYVHVFRNSEVLGSVPNAARLGVDPLYGIYNAFVVLLAWSFVYGYV
ncbi:glycoside hydrolase family 16 protein [Ceratobasidium sp. AG-Ba]|nr:glycoside hydrolase family 16 protein [Ceratobasidium sp. AG-Ba]QRW02659.1 glycoside hydrolase family 16 protein [Ceratobasidium sp. AG-Ba]